MYKKWEPDNKYIYLYRLNSLERLLNFLQLAAKCSRGKPSIYSFCPGGNLRNHGHRRANFSKKILQILSQYAS